MQVLSRLSGPRFVKTMLVVLSVAALLSWLLATTHAFSRFARAATGPRSRQRNPRKYRFRK